MLVAAATLLLPLGACGTAGLVLDGPPQRPFDAVVIPGCPVEGSGALSRCLKSRVLWGAVLWERGHAQRFIVSGAAVHSPFVEAEALAAGLAALGVPADRIWLEPEAFHTDENMYDSAQIARALGLRELGVASNGGHATWGCRMLREWGQPCRALPVDLSAARALHARTGDAVDRVRVSRVSDEKYGSLRDREAERARRAGRPRRPPSFLVYLRAAIGGGEGERWVPFAPATATRLTWADHLARTRTAASAATP